MAETINMPKLGFDMAEGTLVRWVIGEGKPVAKGNVLAEIETDKATVEVESNFDGVLAVHLVPEGSIVPVNTPIAIVAAPGEKVERPGDAPAATASTPAAEKAPTPAAAAAAPQAAPVAAAVVEQRVATLTEAEIEQIVERAVGKVIERLAGTVLERVAWEVVPDLAEALIKEEIRKIKDAAA